MSDAQLGLEDSIALLTLMTYVNEVSNVELRARYGFAIDGQLRVRLEKQGYITCRPDENHPRHPFVHELTDKGWRWCRDELAAEPPKGATKPYRVLYRMLNHIDRYLESSHIPPDRFFLTDQEPTADVEELIRTAYGDLTKGPGRPVSLRLLRPKLAHVPREEVDAALMRLDRQPGILLEPETHQRNLTEKDTNAAIVIGGEPKHLLSIQ